MNVTTQKQTPMGMMTAVKMPEARWVAAGGQENCAGLGPNCAPPTDGEECVVCVKECGGGGGPSGGQCGGGGGA